MTVPWQETSMREHVDLISEGGGKSLTWGGRFCWKNPLDLIIYQEIVQEVLPTLIIETGSHSGGSAMFWRDMQTICGIASRVISVDVTPAPDPLYGVTFLTGSSTSMQVLSEIERAIQPDDRVLMNLDSDHAYIHVMHELDAYAPLVTPGSYLIVEDGIDDYRHERIGPHAATVDWLAQNPGLFEIDKHRERLGLTNCPDGFLRKL